MAGNIAQVRQKVQDYLVQSFTNVTLGKEGMLSLRHGSARMFIEVQGHPDTDWTWITLTVPVLSGLKASPELYEYIARHADDYIFGHFHLDTWADGEVIMLRHRLLGEYLDAEELRHAVAGVLGSADEVDDELKAKFGGERYHED